MDREEPFVEGARLLLSMLTEEGASQNANRALRQGSWARHLYGNWSHSFKPGRFCAGFGTNPLTRIGRFVP